MPEESTIDLGHLPLARIAAAVGRRSEPSTASRMCVGRLSRPAMAPFSSNLKPNFVAITTSARRLISGSLRSAAIRAMVAVRWHGRKRQDVYRSPRVTDSTGALGHPAAAKAFAESAPSVRPSQAATSERPRPRRPSAPRWRLRGAARQCDGPRPYASTRRPVAARPPHALHREPGTCSRPVPDGDRLDR